MKINRKGILVFWICLFVTSAFFISHDAYAQEKIDPILWEKAFKLTKASIAIDTHTDTPMALDSGMDLGKRTETIDVDFVRMKESGLTGVFFAAFVSNRLDNNNPNKKANELIDAIFNQVNKNPTLAAVAYSPNDIKTLYKEGKRAILIGIENGSPVEGSLDKLREFYKRGVRYITLTHNSNNQICDSATDEKPLSNGLSEFGKTVVTEMNNLGMLIDVSHISDKSFWDVIALSRAPVFASHSCVRSICNVPRNMTDDMIRALAKKGGVIQINFYSYFLDGAYSKKADEARKTIDTKLKALRETYKDDNKGYYKEYSKLWKEIKPEPPSIGALIDHIDYVVKLVGIDHVGLGSDFDGADSYPVGLENVTGYPLITYHLLKRGYKDEDIKKILGGNFLRFFDSVIQTAKRINKPGHK